MTRARIDQSPRAALFDLDGTLADTLEDIAEAVNSALSAARLPTHETERYRLMVGNGFENLIRAATSGCVLPSEVFGAILADARARYAARCLDRTRPYEGAHELLSGLAELGIPIAVLSNKPHGLTVHMVSSLFPGIPFTDVRGEQPGVPRKPDPRAALEIAGMTKVQPFDWLYAGDSDVDMRTALAAGMRPCGVAWGFRSVTELEESGAAAIMRHPLDILAVFRAMR